MAQKHVVLGITGSIAAYKACDILRRLKEADCDVSVVMTREATRFVTPLTFEALSQKLVYTEMFSDKSDWDMAHISLAKWADLFLIAPATANVIGKMAGGLGDDLLTCTALTTRAPLVVAPAMNTQMFENNIVQKNIATLKDNGVYFIEPSWGKLACGDVGKGHLAKVDDIVQETLALLK